MTKQPIILSEEIIPPPALVRAGLETLPLIIRTQGERASRRFIEFFAATIRNRNTRMAYARAVKQFCDWCDDHRLKLEEIEAVTVATSNSTLPTEQRFSQRHRRPACSRQINSLIM